MCICTVYAFEVSAFLIQPLFIPVPGAIYVVSHGWINILGRKGLQLCVYAFLALLVSHVVAVGLCVLYQYAQVATFRPVKMVFQSRQSMTYTYLGITGFYSISFLIPVSLSDQLSVDPATFNASSDVSTEAIFRDAKGLHLFLLPGKQLLVVLIAYFLVSVPFVSSLAYICWRVYATVYNWSGFRSSRTSQMQFALFKVTTSVPNANCMGIISLVCGKLVYKRSRSNGISAWSTSSPTDF